MYLLAKEIKPFGYKIEDDNLNYPGWSILQRYKISPRGGYDYTGADGKPLAKDLSYPYFFGSLYDYSPLDIRKLLELKLLGLHLPVKQFELEFLPVPYLDRVNWIGKTISEIHKQENWEKRADVYREYIIELFRELEEN